MIILNKYNYSLGNETNFDLIPFDFQTMTIPDAENLAKEMSIKDPNDIYYVKIDDIMNPDTDIRWINGKSYRSSQVKLVGDKPKILLEKQHYRMVVKKESGLNDKRLSSIDESVTFSNFVLDSKGKLHSTSDLLKGYSTTKDTSFICPRDEYSLVEIYSDADGQHIVQCTHCQTKYAYEDDDLESFQEI